VRRDALEWANSRAHLVGVGVRSKAHAAALQGCSLTHLAYGVHPEPNPEPNPNPNPNPNLNPNLNPKPNPN
jgi:hypothetical protein